MNEQTKVHPIVVFKEQLDKRVPEFNRALPNHIPVERFTRVLLTAVQQTPALMKADRQSLFTAATRAAQDGLLPDGREGAIVMFGDKAQWMPMIAGLRKKVRQSGEIATWDVSVVYAKDDFDYRLGDDPNISHTPYQSGARGDLKAVYSIATLKSGEKSREVMFKDEIDAIRKRSRSGGSGPWVTDYSEMARKTVARRHAKSLPMSTDVDEMFHREDAVFGASEAERVPQAPAYEGEVNGLAGRLDAIAERPKRPYNKRTRTVETVDATTGEVTQGSQEPDDDTFPGDIDSATEMYDRQPGDSI